MPHCIIEITQNIFDKTDKILLMKGVAEVLDKVGCFITDDIKIRVYPVENYFVGTDNSKNSYVATEIQVLDNKSDEELSQIFDGTHNFIVNFFKNLAIASITTKLSLIKKDHYRRTVNY